MTSVFANPRLKAARAACLPHILGCIPERMAASPESPCLRQKASPAFNKERQRG
jgi:hypothetical protein